ncbi:tripartite tricarboxylate transporter substrate binding protein [Roseomonas sp. NAR14]|uniref:Tripartite tricarboxylate transporter substrate binding protein n=1 Tax=Roseomonas acroporae TaxID=2937791 RepID=A0A9X1YFG9_9PROT|nr:tripartite tricarboxylate transporter substrate binding protein [Roseomonas acroporae]MCK8787697.1 tripartite tricarboxylate transporter substrate binding protein [Roseomonas acroporae]
MTRPAPGHGAAATRRLLLGTALAAGAGAMIRPARAAEYPDRPIRLVVPYSPGGLTDTTARLTGEAIGAALGQTVVVENRPGSNSILGAGTVANSPPDGYTLVMVIGAHAANATLYAGRLPFDPIASFAPISHVVTTPLVLAGSRHIPPTTLRELLDYAKARPGQVNYGSSGVGSAAHLAMEDLMRRTGVQMEHVPYRGTQPALQDLLAGRLGCMFDVYSSFGPHLEANTIRGLGVASTERPPFARGIPTIIEGGVPDFEASAWCLLLAPARTPPAIVERLSAAVAGMRRDPAMVARLDGLGLTPVGSTPDEAARFLRAEIDRWGAVIRAAKVQVE